MYTIDARAMREDIIKLNQLRDVDLEYTFYYDETNNNRSFKIRENGFNSSENANFVLGGVMHIGKKCRADIDLLFEQLKLQKTVKELKLKHIADEKHFLDCLKSKKLNTFLTWLNNSDLYIHYMSVNNLYFALVDIIDSILVDDPEFTFNIDFTNMLKSELYQFATKNIEEITKLLYDFEYPDIDTDRVIDFCNKLINLIESQDDISFGLEFNRRMIKTARKNGALCFLQNNKKYVMQENYACFYIEPIELFINSHHIFDEETEVMKKFEQFEMYDGDDKLDTYKFVKSDENRMIQISDVFVGLLGKYFIFINSMNFFAINNFDENLNQIQKKNFAAFRSLIEKSNEKNKALIHTSASAFELKKGEIVMEIVRKFNGD